MEKVWNMSKIDMNLYLYDIYIIYYSYIIILLIVYGQLYTHYLTVGTNEYIITSQLLGVTLLKYLINSYWSIIIYTNNLKLTFFFFFK